MKKQEKNESAITLVALVITIIILLILAGISIQTLTQTNLFGKTEQAKEEMGKAQKKENDTLSSYMDAINEYLPDTLSYKVSKGEIEIGSYVNYVPDTVTENDEKYKELNRKLTENEWKQIEDYIDFLGFENGFVQELGEHEEEYVPKWW